MKGLDLMQNNSNLSMNANKLYGIPPYDDDQAYSSGANMYTTSKGNGAANGNITANSVNNQANGNAKNLIGNAANNLPQNNALQQSGGHSFSPQMSNTASRSYIPQGRAGANTAVSLFPQINTPQNLVSNFNAQSLEIPRSQQPDEIYTRDVTPPANFVQWSDSIIERQFDDISTLNRTSIQYLNGFLRTQIGKNVRVQFLFGCDLMVERFGELISVGANYILLSEAETGYMLACDFKDIKFIRFE